MVQGVAPAHKGLAPSHRNYNITEEQRQRFTDLFMVAADEANLPTDSAFREALQSHVDFGSHVAKQNSNANTDDELHPLRKVPKWDWPVNEGDNKISMKKNC